MTHKLIHTPDYLLVVDDSEIKEGDWCFLSETSLFNAKIGRVNKNVISDNGKNGLNFKKIIAHLPLNDSPILEGVDLLPPFSRHQEDGIEELAHTEYRVSLQPIGRTLAGGKYDVDINYESRIGFIKGYNKAKEKYKYTEEDMWEIFVRGMGAVKHEELGTISAKQVFDNYLQSLSQPKMPVGFECEENTFFATNAFSSDITLTSEGLQDTVLKGIKTTTNSQGQIVWVGKYCC